MKTKEKDSQKRDKKSNSNFIQFLKANWALFVLIILAIIVVFCLAFVVLTPYLNKKSLENDIASLDSNSYISISKVILYSNAYAINNSSKQDMWDLNLSQYTDIAIYLDVLTDVTSMYIDNISFVNNNTGNLSLCFLPIENFGKSPIYDLELSKDNALATNKINDSIIGTSKKIDLDLSSPIILRYYNQNLKKNCLITDVENPISFDGSILKRGKVTFSSLKNTISFNLHIVTFNNQDFALPVNIPINFENKETGKSIYDGSYFEEQLY